MNTFSFPPAIKTFISGCAVSLLAGAVFTGPAHSREATAQPVPDFRLQMTGKRSVNLAVTAYNKGKIHASIAYSKNALIQGLRLKDKSVAYSNLCAALGTEHRYKEARSACDKALKLNPENWQAYANRASVNWRDSKYAQARFDIKAAQKIAGSNAWLNKTAKIIG